MNGRMDAEQMAAEHEAKQPVAWAVWSPEWHEPLITFCPDAAEEHAAKWGQNAVPLYRQPQPALTDAEREAVERSADWLDRWQQTHGYHSAESGDLATLRGLLARSATSTTSGDV